MPSRSNTLQRFDDIDRALVRALWRLALSGRYNRFCRHRLQNCARRERPPLPLLSVMHIRLESFTNNRYAAARASWEATDGVALSGADSEQCIAQFLARNSGMSYVALDDAKLVATILVGHDGRCGLIRHLVVGASHRRQRIGTRLVAEGLAALGRAGMQKWQLLVFVGNAEGREFWRAMGAEHREELVVYSLTTLG